MHWKKNKNNVDIDDKKRKNTRYEAVDSRLNITVGKAEEKEL